MKVYIKNMACHCCIALVKDEAEKLGLTVLNTGLGEVDIKGKASNKKLKTLDTELKKAGLEIVENKKGILFEKIKQVIHETIYNSKERLQVNFSRHLSNQLDYDYSYLSKFFSEMQATTIEQYIINLKIERAKELLLFHNMTLAEIVNKLHYSSIPHLSSQFKKVTGLTPSYFRKLKKMRGSLSPEFFKKYDK